MPVLCVVPPQGRDQLHDKMISGIQEVRARGARTICLAEEGDDAIAPYADELIPLPAGAGAAPAAGRRRTAAAVRLRAGHAAGPRRRPAAQPGQVRHGRVGLGATWRSSASASTSWTSSGSWPSLERTPGAARAAVHAGRGGPAAGLAGRPVRRQGGARQGARRPGRPGLARRRGGLGGLRPSGVRAARHRPRPRQRPRRRLDPPLALPRRRHRLRGRGAGGLTRLRTADAGSVGDVARRSMRRCAATAHGEPAVVLHGSPGVGALPWWRRYLDHGPVPVVLLDGAVAVAATPSPAIRWRIGARTRPGHRSRDLEPVRAHVGSTAGSSGGSWSTLGLRLRVEQPERVTELVGCGASPDQLGPSRSTADHQREAPRSRRTARGGPTASAAATPLAVTGPCARPRCRSRGACLAAWRGPAGR